MRLRHLHLPCTAYAHAAHLQALLAHQHLQHKVLAPPLRALRPAPPPSLLTFESEPTYTLGRRERRSTPAAQLAHLRRGGRAAVHGARRGGQTTFHGPGQVTAFLVLALDAHALRPAAHVRLLEDAAAGAAAAHGVRAGRTQHPGAWVGAGGGAARKLAAVGAHLRRNVSLFGLGLNVSVELDWFERIVACGLEGVETTTLWRERERACREADGALGPLDQPSCAEVADTLAEQIAQRLQGVEGIEALREEEILAIEEEESWKASAKDPIEEAAMLGLP